MLKKRFWIGVSLAPILFATAGCSISQRPFANTDQALPPHKLMSKAATLERQGRLDEAKLTYLQILVVQRDYPGAQQKFDAIVASEAKQQDRLWQYSPPGKSKESLASKDAAAPAKSSKSQPASTDSKSETSVEKASLADSASSANGIVLSSATGPLTSKPADQPVLAVVAVDLPSPEPIFGTTEASKAESRDSQEAIVSESTVSETLPTSPIIGEYEDVLEREMLHKKELVATTTIGEPSTLETSGTPEKQIADVLEAIEFVRPIVRPETTINAELEQFFGPFHTGMVLNLQANRERYQSMLAAVVADHDAGRDDRSRAVFLLGTVGPDAIDAVPSLRREMHHDADEYLQVDIAEALLKIRPDDEDAMQILVDRLKGTDENVRWIAAFALRSAVSPRTTFVIDSLIGALKTDDSKLQRMVFLTLAEYGPAAAKAVPQLEAALNSPDPITRDVAKASLASIAPDRKTTEKTRKTTYRADYALSE